MTWFVEAFGPWYSIVYPHRDRKEAAALIAALSRVLELRGARWLDVGCGAGRHLAQIAETGAAPIGLDLSPELLDQAKRARRETGGRWPLLRGDMRSLPVADSAVDGVSSLFTTFGYFEPDDDRVVLREAARILRPGGFHVLDFLNREQVQSHLSPETERRSGDWRVQEWRRIEKDRRVVKRIRVTPAAGGTAVADYEERVTLYSPAELAGMLEEAGLVVHHRWGEYDGRAFDATASSRVILLSRKEVG